MSKSEPLAKKKCVPCEGGVPPLAPDEVRDYLADLKNWTLSSDGKSVRVEYLMKNFGEAIKLIQKIAEIAEREDHHPDIHLTGYRKLVIELTTHAIGGLSENDFILAAKIDEIPKALKSLKS